MLTKDKAAGLGTTAASRSDYTHNYSTNDIGRIRDALSFIPAADRDTWLQMAMAVKSELGDPGFDLWDAWSQQADSYNAKDARDVWKSLKANGRVTAGTLFYEAKARGWRDDGTRQKPTAEEIEARRRQSAERAAKQEVEKAREHAEARGKRRRYGCPRHPLVTIIPTWCARAFPLFHLFEKSMQARRRLSWVMRRSVRTSPSPGGSWWYR